MFWQHCPLAVHRFLLHCRSTDTEWPAGCNATQWPAGPLQRCCDSVSAGPSATSRLVASSRQLVTGRPQGTQLQHGGHKSTQIKPGHHKPQSYETKHIGTTCRAHDPVHTPPKRDPVCYRVSCRHIMQQAISSANSCPAAQLDCSCSTVCSTWRVAPRQSWTATLPPVPAATGSANANNSS